MRLNLSILLATFSASLASLRRSNAHTREFYDMLDGLAEAESKSRIPSGVFKTRRQLVRNNVSYYNDVMFGNLPFVEEISELGKDILLGFEDDLEQPGYISDIW